MSTISGDCDSDGVDVDDVDEDDVDADDASVTVREAVDEVVAVDVEFAVGSCCCLRIFLAGAEEYM